MKLEFLEHLIKGQELVCSSCGRIIRFGIDEIHFLSPLFYYDAEKGEEICFGDPYELSLFCHKCWFTVGFAHK